MRDQQASGSRSGLIKPEHSLSLTCTKTWAGSGLLFCNMKVAAYSKYFLTPQVAKTNFVIGKERRSTSAASTEYSSLDVASTTSCSWFTRQRIQALACHNSSLDDHLKPNRSTWSETTAKERGSAFGMVDSWLSQRILVVLGPEGGSRIQAGLVHVQTKVLRLRNLPLTHTAHSEKTTVKP